MITLVLPYPISGPGIYRITDSSSGRFYIGSSVNVAKRWLQHQGRLRSGTHPNPALQAIWNKNPARLTCEMFQPTEPTREALLRAEQLALDAARAGTDRACLNVLPVAGSHLGRKRTEATRRALAAAQTGKRHTDQTKALMRAAKIGKPLSAEHRKKVGDALRGKKLPPRDRLPRPELRRLTNEQVLAIRAARAAGSSYTQLHAMHRISRGALQRLLARKTYAEVV